MALSSAENGNAHKKLSDWRNKLASKFKKSVGDQVTILLMKFGLKKNLFRKIKNYIQKSFLFIFSMIWWTLPMLTVTTPRMWRRIAKRRTNCRLLWLNPSGDICITFSFGFIQTLKFRADFFTIFSSSTLISAVFQLVHSSYFTLNKPNYSWFSFEHC